MSNSRFPRGFWGDHATAARIDENSTAEAAAERQDGSSSPAEVILSEHGSNQQVRTRPLPTARPYGVFVPQNYEANYAYPLVVWLHSAGRSERDIADVLPGISMRNYIGLALRGNAFISHLVPGGFGWSRSERARNSLQTELQSAVRYLREEFHVHSERVFLVGEGEGATAAWDLFLARPEWFAGLAACGGRFPWGRRPLRHFHQLRGKQVFLAADSQEASASQERQRVGRLIYSAGLEISEDSVASKNGRRLSLYRKLDRWIMRAIGGCV